MILGAVLKALLVFVAVTGVFAPIITWVERKQGALMQDRIGANRAAIGGATLLGLFHPAADLLKLIAKEDIVPRGADRHLHLAAPLMAAIPPIIALAVIPFGGRYRFGASEVSLVVADIDWGVLYILAVSALAAYGPVIAGWASNNNWSLLGGMRATAQMVSYQVTLGLSLVPLFMIFGSLRLTDMGMAQDATVSAFGWLQHFGVGELPSALASLSIPAWGVFLNPPAFVMFLTCLMAESKRPPFDLPQAESELVAGYHTEYSGMRFGLFYVSELVQVVVIAGLVTAVFLGGWSVPWLPQATIVGGIADWLGEGVGTAICLLLHVCSFLLKVCAMIWLQMSIRWSLPRFRYDQLMDLCWKIILPASLINVFVTAFVMLVLGEVDA